MHRPLRVIWIIPCAVAAALLTAAVPDPSPTLFHWTPAWATAPTAPITQVPAGVVPVAPMLKGTVRYRVMLAASGTRLVLKFSNEVRTEPLAADTVSVTGPNTSRPVPVTFGGESAVDIAPGSPAFSDPVDLTVRAGDQIVVSVHLPRGYVATQSQAANKAEYLPDRDGADPALVSNAVHVSVRPIVSAVLVAARSASPAIVTFGDSITDGAGSRQAFVRGWPDVLAIRLRTQRGRAPVPVVNAGISGNRLLATTAWGLSALARFDRDVLSLPNVGHVVVLEGINDIGALGDAPATPPVTADRLINSYRQIIARSRQHGIRVIGGTLLPFAGARYFSLKREAVRQQVNSWIRTSSAFDGVIDFDAAVRDPARPERMLEAYDSGDHLHPSDAGYRAMGDAVDLRLFR